MDIVKQLVVAIQHSREKGFEDVTISGELAEAVLERLKEQEPLRVLTLDEIEHRLESMWLEVLVPADDWIYDDSCATVLLRAIGTLGTRVFIDRFGMNWKCDPKEYGRRWRCWSALPDDKQREATAWK